MRAFLAAFPRWLPRLAAAFCFCVVGADPARACWAGVQLNLAYEVGRSETVVKAMLISYERTEENYESAGSEREARILKFQTFSTLKGRSRDIWTVAERRVPSFPLHGTSYWEDRRGQMQIIAINPPFTPHPAFERAFHENGQLSKAKFGFVPDGIGGALDEIVRAPCAGLVVLPASRMLELRVIAIRFRDPSIAVPSILVAGLLAGAVVRWRMSA